MEKLVKTEAEKKLSDEVKEILELFYEINPALNFANKTIRGAAEWMVKKWGIDEVRRMTEMVIACQGMDFAPVATNPYEMKNKLLRFKLFFNRCDKFKKQLPKPTTNKVFGEDLKL